MADRPLILARPYIRGAYYDRLAKQSVLHADLYAYRLEGETYFKAVYTLGGRKALVTDLYRLTEAGALSPWLADIPKHARALLWDRSNASAFARAHKELLDAARWRAGALGLRLSVLAHYVGQSDTHPIYGLANTWRYKGQYALGERILDRREKP